MANEVKITLAAETKDFQKEMEKAQDVTKDTSVAFNKLDKAASSASDGFKRSGDRMGSSFDRLSDGADRSEQRIVGMRDGITGTKDLMEGWRTGSMELVLTGLADLASSVANFAGPALSRMANFLKLNVIWTKAQAAAQTVLNAVMNANPYVKIALLLAALAAAVVVAYQKSETFRNIVKGAFDAVKNAANSLKDAGQAVIDKLVALYNHPVGQAIAAFYVGKFKLMWEGAQKVASFVGDIIEAIKNAYNSPFITKLKEGIVGAFNAMASPITTTKNAIDAVIGKIEWAIKQVNRLRDLLPGNTKVDQKKVEDRLYGGTVPGRGANGRLATRPTIAGEAGPELILPLTRPKRARELANEHLGTSGPTVTVQQMVVQDSTDVYRIAGQLNRLYKMAY